MSEAFARIAPDSTGDRIRTNELTLLQADGTRVVVSMQVISIADAAGNMIGLQSAPLHVDSRNLGSVLEDLTDEIRKLRQLIELNSGNSL
jgi:hypothetical protein